MASSVFYKFKSQREESKVSFDGTGISVFDLKKEILLSNNLGKASDFDLVVLDGSSGEEFKDDSHVIPRSTSVVVKRMPPARPGKGKAAMYIAAPGTSATPESSRPNSQAGNTSWPSRGSLSRRFDKEVLSSRSAPQTPPQSLGGNDEMAAMAAMFQAQSANWEETQEKNVTPNPGLHQFTWHGCWRSRRQAIYAPPAAGRSAAPAQLCVLPLWTERPLDPRLSDE